MMTHAKFNIGFICVALAGIFLCDPMIGFADRFPDVIGYLLLCIGLSKLSDLNESIADATGRFRVMLLVGVGQLVASYILHVVMVEKVNLTNPYERPVAILLCSFVVAVLRCYFLIPAFRDLFKGLGRLAELHGNRALCSLKKNRTCSERMTSLTVGWIVLSGVLSVLPEFSILTSFEHDVESEVFTFDWYRFIEMFRSIAAVLSLILALVWLLSFLRYFSKAEKDKEWIGSLCQRYESEILTQTGMLTVRRFSLGFLLIKIGAVFTVSLRISEIAVLPSVCFAVLLLLALAQFDWKSEEAKNCKILCWILGFSSLWHVGLNLTYLSKFLPEASLYQTDAYWHFLAMRVAGACEAVITLITVGTLLKLLVGVVKAHTEVDYGTNSVTVSARATEKLHRELEKRLNVIFVIFSLAALANTADALLQLTVPWIWSIGLVLSVVGLFLLSSFLHELLTLIKNRYQPKV